MTAPDQWGGDPFDTTVTISLVAGSTFLLTCIVQHFVGRNDWCAKDPPDAVDVEFIYTVSHDAPEPIVNGTVSAKPADETDPAFSAQRAFLDALCPDELPVTIKSAPNDAEVRIAAIDSDPSATFVFDLASALAHPELGRTPYSDTLPRKRDYFVLVSREGYLPDVTRVHVGETGCWPIALDVHLEPSTLVGGKVPTR